MTYSVTSGPATISGSTLTITGAGTVVLSASQIATANYNAPTNASTSFTVNKGTPTLSFASVATQAFGVAPFSVSASSASTGAVTYSVTSGPATISGSTLTITGVGTVVLAASQAATANYNAPTNASTSFTVNKGTPTLRFTSIATQTFGVAPFSVSASSASTGAVTYSVTSGPATISGSTVTITGVGTVVLGASQAATANYNAPANASVSFTVSKATPSLSLATSGSPTTYGASVTFTATISSGLSGNTLTFYDSGTSIGSGTISGTTATFATSTLVGGTHAITAGWAGSTNYNAVTSNTITQTVSKVTPTLGVTTSGTPSTYAGSVTFTATISSGPTGAVTFYDSGTPVGTGTISGTTAIFTTNSLTAGTHTITADWPGNTNYVGATSSAITQTVTQATPTITWPTPASIAYGTALSATQLNASTTAAGTFAYTPASGAIPPAGSNTLQVTFTPLDPTDYASVTTTVTLTVTTSPSGPGVINTVAGNGLWNGSIATPPQSVIYSGPATSAYMSAGDVVVDASGNLYVSDYENNVVRKVTFNGTSAPTIATVVGTGTASYSGDYGPATSATLYAPEGLAMDSSGSLYIADFLNNVIRKVTSPGTASATITTVAGNYSSSLNDNSNLDSGDGGSATSAVIIEPGNIAVDNSGNIYVIDHGSGYYGIRKVTASNGVISRFAGNGTSGCASSIQNGSATSIPLCIAAGLAVDSAGNVYFSERNVIRKVTTAGYISTIAGSGTSGPLGDGYSAMSATLNGPGSVAFDAAGNMYIADTGNDLIREVSAATGNISTIAGDTDNPPQGGYSGDGAVATAALLQNPSGIALDSSGNIFFTDAGVAFHTLGDDVVRKINAPGITKTTPTVSVTCPTEFVTYATSSICTVNVSGNATGTVSLTYNGTAWATVSLTSGSGTATWPATLTVGAYTILATYNGDSNNSTATGSTSMSIIPATPIISWSKPANISSSTALSATQKNATANVTGSFAYSFTAGQSLAPGNYTLSVVFTPTDTTDYATTTAAVDITVTPPAGTPDTGTVTLTVNNSTVATTNYGSTSTTSSVAEALAANVVAGSPVTVTAVDDAVYIQATATGPTSNYSYSLQATSNNPTVFSTPSFMDPAVSGNLDGGATQDTQGQPVYSYTVPAGGYDAVGNLVSYSDVNSAGSVMGAWGFQYDTLNRLISGTPTSGPYNGKYACWSYDAFGNRTAQTLQTTACPTLPAVPTPTAAYNSYNQMTWTSVNSAGNSFSYDASGDVTYDGAISYLYDAEGRICAVRNEPVPGTYTMTGYIYDASGARVAKGSITTWSCNPSISGFSTTNDYILGPSGEQFTEMAMDANNTMAWQHTNVYTASQLIATYDNDGLHFYLDDPLGTRRAQTDYAGVLEQTCSSLPYGDELTCTGSILEPTEHHFTGKERDAESGNDYFEARYYSSGMGRFMSPDWAAKEEPVPYADLDDPQSLNLYSYVTNNPLARADADGHDASDVLKLTAAADLIAPEAAPIITGVGLGVALGAVVWDHRDAIGNAFNDAMTAIGKSGSANGQYGDFSAQAPPLSNVQMNENSQAKPEATSDDEQKATGSPGGGRNAQKANPVRVDAATKNLAGAKADLEKAKQQKPSKDRSEAIKKAQQQIKHWQKKVAEKSENHSQKAKGQQQ